MKPLFIFAYQHLSFVVSFSEQGEQEVRCNNQIVSRKVVQTPDGPFNSVHDFTLPELGAVRLRFQIDVPQSSLRFVFEDQSMILHEGEMALQVQNAAIEPARKRGISWGLLGLAFKLFKSAGALKAALAGTALAGWAWLFNLEFAICLIIALFLHEFGHVWAMKQSGMKVKGIYLLPFIGGVAVGEASTSRWMDFKISMAGPAIGAMGAFAGWLAWLATDNPLFATFAMISLFLNLFNMLPIVPLDGGQAIKAMVFSKQGKFGIALLLFISALIVALSFSAGLYLLVFFGVLGAVDILASGRTRGDFLRCTPMNNYGIVFCLVAYFGLLGAMALLAFFMAATGLEGANLPLVFLSS